MGKWLKLRFLSMLDLESFEKEFNRDKKSIFYGFLLKKIL